MSKFRFENLDSIRTVAFFTVFLAHSVASDIPSIIGNPIYNFFDVFRSVFSFGVPVFFVLSGFLISYLMLKEQEGEAGFSVKNFYMRRVLRIWPVYYVVIIFGFVIFPLLRTYVLHLPYIENANLFNYIFFISNFDQIINNQLPFGVGLGPTWSVGVEEQFYLLWPLVITLFKKRKFIIPIIGFIVISTGSSVLLSLDTQHTLYCFMYLSTGALFAYLSFYYFAIIEKITKVNPIVFFVSLGLMIFLIMEENNILGFMKMLVISMLIGYLIVYQCFSGRIQLKKIPLLEKLGKYTYGLYLYHSICIFIIHTMVLKILKIEENAVTVVLIIPILSLILSIFISIFSYKYFESFFLRLKDKYSSI